MLFSNAFNWLMFQNWLADFVICFIEIKKKIAKLLAFIPIMLIFKGCLWFHKIERIEEGRREYLSECAPLYLISWYLSNKGGTLLSCHSVPPCGPPSPAPPDRGTSPCTPWDPDNGHTENLNIDVTLLIWSEVDLLWIFSTGNKK